jgi:hypothetical protein
MSLRLPKIDKTMHLVTVTVSGPDGKTFSGYGVISPEGQRYWQSAAIRADGAGDDVSAKVTKMEHVIYGGATISSPPSQDDVQAIADALKQIAKAMTE